MGIHLEESDSKNNNQTTATVDKESTANLLNGEQNLEDCYREIKKIIETKNGLEYVEEVGKVLKNLNADQMYKIIEMGLAEYLTGGANADEVAKMRAESHAKVQAYYDRHREEEAKKKAEEESKKIAEEFAKMRAEEEAKKKTEGNRNSNLRDARKNLEEEVAKKKADEEAKKKADEVNKSLQIIDNLIQSDVVKRMHEVNNNLLLQLTRDINIARQHYDRLAFEEYQRQRQEIEKKFIKKFEEDKAKLDEEFKKKVNQEKIRIQEEERNKVIEAVKNIGEIKKM